MTQPITDNMDHVTGVSPSSDVTAEMWTEVHEQVQRQLTGLESEVRRQVAGLRVDQGRTTGDQFHLFSYRTFSLPDSGLDPVVSGLTFTPAEQGVTVEADVSGEQTGDYISSVPSKTVANSREQLLAAACESARKRCQSAGAIVTALRNASRRPQM